MSLHAELNAAADSITEQGPRPVLGIVLGSGLGAFARSLQAARSLSYTEIPGMPGTSVSGHAGELWLGSIANRPVACLSGRAHLYEGHRPEVVVFGVRLLARLGVQAVLLTNAAGGLGEGLAAGDLMLVEDHLNLTGANPLVGEVVSGPRFPDMTRAYDSVLGQLAEQAALELGIRLKQGIYAGVVGPSYETPAEIRMLQRLGADAVGMSTVLETIALRQLGVRVAAISLISNLAAGLSAAELTHEDVQRTAQASGQRFAALMLRWCELVLGEAF